MLLELMIGAILLGSAALSFAVINVRRHMGGSLQWNDGRQLKRGDLWKSE
jgi:hypothetical protein